MKLNRLYLPVFLIVFSSYTLAQYGDEDQLDSLPYRNPGLSMVREQLTEHSQNIKNVQANLRALEERLQLFPIVPALSLKKDSNVGSLAEPLAYPLVSDLGKSPAVISSVLTEQVTTDEKMGVPELVPTKNRVGFYILPFIAIQGSSGLDYMHPTLKSNMEHELGFASGWRVGAETKRLFVEGELFYNRNELKGTAELANGIPGFSTLSSVGESESFGFMVNAGGKFSLSLETEFLLGGGFGGMNQEIGFVLAGFPVPESEHTVFSGQLFAGINHQLAEHFRLGARYRWMRVGKMDLFSYRSLHLAELSLGYVF